jgi:hypothetical protein
MQKLALKARDKVLAAALFVSPFQGCLNLARFLGLPSVTQGYKVAALQAAGA